MFTTNPGDVVSCATSPNGYCVATDKSITTDQGEEWILQPASFEQATGGKARNELNEAAVKAQLQGLSNELFTAGCGGAGPAGAGCSFYMFAGGSNPVTGEAATGSERVVWGIQSLLSAWGVFGSVYTGGIKATADIPLKLGETKVIDGVSEVRVGRWMSPTELAQMKDTGRVVQGGGGQTFISINGALDFKGAASKGAVYVEFDVPSNSLLQGGKEGWLKMIGPDASKSQQFLLNKQGGQHLPEVKNILIIDRK
ncbi:TreTu family toxin [Pseudomonas sp. CFBP 5748]